MRRFARLYLDLAAREDLTPADKLIAALMDYFCRVEGRRPSAREVAEASGLSDRTVRSALGRLAGGEARPESAKIAAPASGKIFRAKRQNFPPEAEKISAAPPLQPPVAVTKTEKQRETEEPSASLSRGPREVQTTATKLYAAMVVGGGTWTAERVAGQVAEDGLAGLYTGADIEAALDVLVDGQGLAVVTAAPWRLREVIPRAARAARQRQMTARIERIRSQGLVDARQGERGGKVVYLDPAEGLVVIEEVVPVEPPVTLDHLRAELTDWPENLRGWGAAENLRRRIAALEAGLPDPQPPPPAKAPVRHELRSFAHLDAWEFRPRQPTLFNMDGCVNLGSRA